MMMDGWVNLQMDELMDDRTTEQYTNGWMDR